MRVSPTARGCKAAGGLIGSAKTCRRTVAGSGSGELRANVSASSTTFSIRASIAASSLGIGDAIILDQPLAEHVDRIALDPGVELFLRAVGADDRIAFVMADGAVGLGLDQRRALAGAGALGRLLHGQPDGENVVAVDRDARHAIGGGLGGNLRIERDGFERCRRGVKVVLADEDRRRALHGGEIERLVETAVVGGTVTEEGNADIVAPLLASADADADGVANAGRDDAVGAEQTDGAIVEMHGAAAAAANAVGLAEQLRHHTAGIGALGKRVAVAAMRRRDPIGAAQMRADADAGRFFADVEVQEARGFTLAAGDLRDAFKTPQEHHVLEQVEKDLSIRQVGNASENFARARQLTFATKAS